MEKRSSKKTKKDKGSVSTKNSLVTTSIILSKLQGGVFYDEIFGFHKDIDTIASKLRNTAKETLQKQAKPWDYELSVENNLIKLAHQKRRIELSIDEDGIRFQKYQITTGDIPSVLKEVTFFSKIFLHPLGVKNPTGAGINFQQILWFNKDSNGAQYILDTFLGVSKAFDLHKLQKKIMLDGAKFKIEYKDSKNKCFLEIRNAKDKGVDTGILVDFDYRAGDTMLKISKLQIFFDSGYRYWLDTVHQYLEPIIKSEHVDGVRLMKHLYGAP